MGPNTERGEPVSSETSNRWCILRTSGPSTLPLTLSLRAAGYDVWTPTLTLRRRRPRSKAKIERDAPILPTFVFARAHHAADLMRLRALPVSPHPAFSVFRHGGRIPLIGDAQIGGLREEEERLAAERDAERDQERRAAEVNARRQRVAELRAAAQSFPVGSRVTVAQDAFAGMMGVVERGKGRAPVVNFGGGMSVTIEAWLLVSAAV
jgi:hypothetical protein